jgi:hypothetical protein
MAPFDTVLLVAPISGTVIKTEAQPRVYWTKVLIHIKAPMKSIDGHPPNRQNLASFFQETIQEGWQLISEQ